jgi:hypothetical protein
MAIEIWPEDMKLQADVRCVVCTRKISVTAATVGLFDYKSDQVFACSCHLGRGESSRFLRAWVDFLLEQDAAEIEVEGELWQMSSLNDVHSSRM